MARTPTLTHWGAYEIEAEDGRITGVHPYPGDPDPSPIGRSMLVHDHPLRVRRPAVRRSWLERGPGTDTQLRGVEPFVEVTWDRALDLAAAEIDRVRTEHGNRAIYSGSYGWASAGRFHHAQSQLRRFMATIGGSTTKVNTYSLAAAEVIVPHVLGYSYDDIQDAHTSWPVIARNTRLFVAFGGLPWKNSQIQSGGQGRHLLGTYLEACREAGVRFVNVGPIRSDLPDVEWWPIRPNTDVALMLALMHELVRLDLADEEFIARYTVGWDRLRDYLLGKKDGTAKDPRWAAEVCDLDQASISRLAQDLASQRSMVNTAWSLQRADHGEQPFWGVIALAAALGQIGLPGGGFGLGYGAVGSVGNGVSRVPLPSVPAPPDPTPGFIPVARVTDMLESPGSTYAYDTATRTYPDIHLIYWAGGNPFHHHQDLGRLVRAWRKPDTVIVNEPWWTATARRADIVFPVTLPLERDDIGGASVDDHLFAMHRAVGPLAEARSDHQVFAGLAERLGAGAEFTAGRSESEWIRWMYERFRERDPSAPPFSEFWQHGHHRQLPSPEAELVLLAEFRHDPDARPLPTPSGRIELWSADIDRAAPVGCPPHPAWTEPAEWLGSAAEDELHLISNQPRTRLHSQWDMGAESQDSKVAGLEPIHLHPEDAAAAGVEDGSVARVWNERGATLAGVRIDDGVRPGVAELATGAWYDPLDPTDADSLDVAGNPNVLTRDAGTSELAQGPSPQTCLVRIEPWDGPLPDRKANRPPPLEDDA
ncbi:MAG TPA: molybdopterin-dependent oxidoreductase [Acidimicrobiia bacterium]|nr:molybdopterin-dependent oxidoreductase [Acidimicrobiia bacterium]